MTTCQERAAHDVGETEQHSERTERMTPSQSQTLADDPDVLAYFAEYPASSEVKTAAETYRTSAIVLMDHEARQDVVRARLADLAATMLETGDIQTSAQERRALLLEQLGHPGEHYVLAARYADATNQSSQATWAAIAAVRAPHERERRQANERLRRLELQQDAAGRNAPQYLETTRQIVAVRTALEPHLAAIALADAAREAISTGLQRTFRLHTASIVGARQGRIADDVIENYPTLRQAA